MIQGIRNNIHQISKSNFVKKSGLAGRSFVTFIDKNKFNIIGTVAGAALLANGWIVSGTVLSAYCTFKVISVAVDSIPNSPRVAKQLFGRSGIAILAGAAGIALIATQTHILGVGLLVFATYTLSDNCGLIPRKLSLSVEKYFPWYGVLRPPVFETSLWAVLSTSSFLLYIPPLSRLIYAKIDHLCRKVFHLNGPSVTAVQARSDASKLCLEEIYTILQAPETAFKLDVRHCSRSAASRIDPLKPRHTFKELIQLSEDYNWEQHSEQIIDHPQFKKFLVKKFPWVSRGKVQKDPLEYAERLAKRKGISSAAYADLWLHARLKNLANILDSRVSYRVKGNQTDLDDAIKNVAHIAACLHSDSCISPEHADEILFKLSLKGSSEKAEDIKKISEKLLRRTVKFHLKHHSELHNKRYEFKILTDLENRRFDLVKERAKAPVRPLKPIVKVMTPADKKKKTSRKEEIKIQTKRLQKYFAGLHRNYLSFGFLPISNHERKNSNLPIQYSLRFCNHLLSLLDRKKENSTSLLKAYREQIHESVDNSDRTAFWSRIECLFIECQLSSQHIDRLKQTFMADINDEATYIRFRSLLLVHLGVLEKKPKKTVMANNN